MKNVVFVSLITILLLGSGFASDVRAGATTSYPSEFTFSLQNDGRVTISWTGPVESRYEYSIMISGDLTETHTAWGLSVTTNGVLKEGKQISVALRLIDKYNGNASEEWAVGTYKSGDYTPKPGLCPRSIGTATLHYTYSYNAARGRWELIVNITHVPDMSQATHHEYFRVAPRFNNQLSSGNYYIVAHKCYLYLTPEFTDKVAIELEAEQCENGSPTGHHYLRAEIPFTPGETCSGTVSFVESN